MHLNFNLYYYVLGVCQVLKGGRGVHTLCALLKNVLKRLVPTFPSSSLVSVATRTLYLSTEL